MSFDATSDGSMNSPQTALSAMFRPQVCANRNYRRVIDAGGIIRFEIMRSRTGESLPPFSIAQCS